MPSNFLAVANEKIILLDGGMGTELFRHGFPQGECPELWNHEKPEIIKSIHQDYYDAGADVVLTNSFGGSKIKLRSYDLEQKCYELNYAAASLAIDVRPQDKFVGGSIGPTGKFLKPQGEFSEDDFIDAYEEQAKGLADGGVDFLLIETQYDLKEALCALKAARKVTSLPVFVTLTFNSYPRGFFTIMGNSVSQCVDILTDAEVPVIGANCNLTSEEMVDLVKIMREMTPLPLVAQANAGKASLSDGNEVVYSQSQEDYVSFIPQIIENGANVVGGCCGTNPDYIRRMSEIVEEANRK
jgi:5-methyltetrahydrofolate--homocysteine methyltransferase